MAKAKHKLGIPFSEVLAEDFADPSFVAAYVARRHVHEVARAIRSLRKRHRMTQEELAQLVGMKQPAIARLETSQTRTARFETLSKIATALGAQLQLLLGTVNEKKPIVKVMHWGKVQPHAAPASH